MQELAHGRTSVFVAHRLSTVQRCDKIVVMADGKVVEQVSFNVHTYKDVFTSGTYQNQLHALQHLRTSVTC